MPVKSLTRMPYVEESWAGGLPVDTGYKVEDTADWKPSKFASVKKQIKNETIDPVHVNNPESIAKTYGSRRIRGASMVLGNGGHRTAVADLLGAHRLPVTPDRSSSGWGKEGD